jgi:hypothetical protein
MKNMSENTDEIAQLGRQLDKALDVLGKLVGHGDCPNQVGLKDSPDCSGTCRDCWKNALSEVEQEGWSQFS